VQTLEYFTSLGPAETIDARPTLAVEEAG
jgi:hypothetical protein